MAQELDGFMKCHGRGCARVSLGILFLFLLGGCQSTSGRASGVHAIGRDRLGGGRATRLANLKIFYGWPSAFDGAKSPRKAAEKLARYDAVVLGDGLEMPTHADHGGATQVVGALRGRATVFGYIPLGHKTGLTLAQIRDRVVAWKKMGISGIFFDEAGYDFGNTRRRQNAAFDAAHAQNLRVFANGYDPDDLFVAKKHPPFNPEGAKTTLRRGDSYLYESFGMILGEAEDATFRRRKLQKLATARALGVQIWGVTTVARAGAPDRMAWRRVVALARAAGLFGLGYGAYAFGASGRQIPFLAPDA